MSFDNSASKKASIFGMAKRRSPALSKQIRLGQRNTLLLFVIGVLTWIYLFSAPSAINTANQYDFTKNVWAGNAELDYSIQKMVSSAPSEILSRDLLRPVNGTGTAWFNEIGLRTRAFRESFDAWEAVHLAKDAEGSYFVRDDIIQYIRATTKIVDATNENSIESPLGTTIRAYERYRSFLEKFTELLFPWFSPYYPDLLALKASFAKGGRGIVLTAGNQQAPFLLTTIPSFRRLGCNLPIEILYLGESDLNADYRAKFEAMPGVITRDMAQMVNDNGWKLAGWASKPFAILLSTFREVIFIDADSAFFQNPEVLFDDLGYQNTGALFFMDRIVFPQNKRGWLLELLPEPFSRNVRQSRMWTGESGHQQESGVLVVDKWRHFAALLLVTRMNGPDRDGDKAKGKTGFYEMVHGDKETFWLGWELAGDWGYSFHQGATGTMGVLEDPKHEDQKKTEGEGQESKEAQTKTEAEGQQESKEAQNKPEKHTICGPQILHLSVDGKLLWFNGWLFLNKFEAKEYAKFQHYVIEPLDDSHENHWVFRPSNVACLTGEEIYEVGSEHNETLSWMIEQAKHVSKLW